MNDHERLALVGAVFTLRKISNRVGTKETRELNRLAFRLAEVVHKSLMQEVKR